MASSKAQGFVVWALDERRFALPVPSVERVLPAAAISPLPGAPRLVSGCLTLRGRAVPVLDLRQALSLPPKETMLDDHLMLVRTAQQRVAFFVDAVQGVADRLDDARLLTDALDALLSLSEQAQLDLALALPQAA